MLYSYLFDGSKREDLETGLPNANGFIVMSQNGIVRCVEKNSCLLPTVRNCVQSRVILGDQSSIVHYFLNTDIFGAGVQNCEDLQEKLANEITPNLTTYAAIRTIQAVIVKHFLGAIANLTKKINGCNHTASISLLGQIRNNYTVLASFQPRYRRQVSEWQQKLLVVSQST